MVDSGSILGVEPTDFLMWGKRTEEENQEFGFGHISLRYPIRLQVGASRRQLDTGLWGSGKRSRLEL